MDNDQPKVRVRERDFGLVLAISGAAFLLLVVFGSGLFASGFLAFPEVGEPGDQRDINAYFNDALVYRERRIVLALVLRTFLTGFSFIVGLALCTMGGVFILRQVTSLTRISGAPGDGAPDTLRRASLSFEAYSPGVVFLAGGVLIMAITQIYTIEIQAIEVTPGGTDLWCFDEEVGAFVTCAGSTLGG
ncbi:MAG: hypothetical protein AAF913_15340, partial [Pseudomonadota bacterium]